MTNREIGPCDVNYREGDWVKILTDCRFGWGWARESDTYDSRIKYYEGEIISLKDSEWRDLGTAQIRPISGQEYQNYVDNPPRFRFLACGIKRRINLSIIQPLTECLISLFMLTIIILASWMTMPALMVLVIYYCCLA